MSRSHTGRARTDGESVLAVVVLALLAVVAAATASFVSAGSSPSPGAGNGHPAPGVEREPAQPQPVHRLQQLVRDLAAQLRHPGRRRRRRPAVQGDRPRRGLAALRRPEGVDLQDPPGRQVEVTASRSRPKTSPSASTTTGKDLELTAFSLGAPGRHQDGHGAPTTPPSGSSSATSPRPTSSPMWASPHDRARACLEPVQDLRRCVTKYLNSPPIVGSGPFQVVEWQKGRFIRCGWRTRDWGG